MKNLKFLILFIAIILINCERDDICAESTSTTPRLLIEFYDEANPDDLKSVSGFTVYGEGLVTDENGDVTEPTEDNTEGTILFNENESSIELPLLIGSESESVTTRYILEKDTDLRLDTEDPEDSNIDVIEITYTPEFIYVSRACGYKSIFTNLSINSNPDGTDNDMWIENIQIQVEENTIENENTIHVHIFH